MKKQLRRLYWIGVCCTLCVTMAAMGLLVVFRISDMSASLRSVLETASAWTMEVNSDLQTHADHIASVSPPIRVTFLMDSGLVLADSEEDAALMENHLRRPEIQRALKEPLGESLRLSDTQSIFMLYTAKRISPNLILRLGYPIEIITHALLFYCIGFVLLFAILNAVLRFALMRFSSSLQKQMDDIRRALEGDSSKPKAVFPELQPALDNIAYLAGRLNSDLAEVNRTLSLRNEFVANASHELRSPLTSVMGFAEMLDEGLAETPEERALCVQTIRSECRRMLDVVEDVLLLSRAERQQELVFSQVCVEKVAEEICRSLSPQAAQKNISLSVEGTMQLRAVEKDVWEILHNLTANAIRYGKNGGYAKILLSERAICVEDDGIGIAREHLPHLFEQFYRVDQSRDPSVRGTGLGLSIVRTLAERNGGCAQVESEPGKGSRFTVYFGKEGASA
ncbi:MAG: HAMP domain-containing sensor histidine kinase [Eubacteriales bacterium]|nr:HAMP domain-containing sensor histidine kinase [Eubacteriales bacterium]